MESPELDRLIVDHLVDIDAAAMRLTMVEREVFRALDVMAEEWAKKNGWEGGFDYLDNGTPRKTAGIAG
jgi:hypothetical protein